MEIITGAKVIGARQEGNSILLEIEHQGEKDTLVGSDILLAVGRSPNTHDIGLESVVIKTREGGFIETDEFMQASNPNFMRRVIALVNYRSLQLLQWKAAWLQKMPSWATKRPLIMLLCPVLCLPIQSWQVLV